MPQLNYNLTPLKEREICGAASYNALLRYALGFRSLSEFLLLNPDGRGSYTIDLDYAALVAALAQSDAGVSLQHDFRCEVTGGDNPALSVEAGRVFLPFTMISVSAFTHALSNADSGKMVYVRLNSTSNGEIVLDSPVTHTLQTGGGNYRTTLPIAILTLANGAWSVHYLHLGAFILTHTPYFWIGGYVRGNAQILGHGASEDGVKWADVDVSDSSSSGSSSSGSSSSSSSGSSSSSSGSSSSSSSSGGASGVLRVTKHNEQAEYPITFDGDYALASGQATDTSGVWQHSAGHQIYYDGNSGQWVLRVVDGYWVGDRQLSISPNTDKWNPSTWIYPLGASDLLSPQFDTYIDVNFIP